MSAQPLPLSQPPVDPTQIGPYRVQRKLGQGGIGAVYEAIDARIARTVAIKVLPPDEPEFHARLLNEARAVNLVRHRGIVGVSDVGRLADGSAYLVMDFLDGQTLRAVMGKRPSRAELLRFARQIASALAATHRLAIFHRDLKPDNVMVVSDDEVVGGRRAIVFDFGIAKLTAEQKHPSTQQDLTDLRFALGTATYMAPEQATGERAVSDRVDVYSLGVMLYEMLSGAPPFSARSYALLLDMHRYATPLALTKLAPDTPPRLAALIMRMLAKQPGERPGMEEVGRGLDEVLRDCAEGAWGVGTLSDQGGRGGEPAAASETPKPSARPSEAPPTARNRRRRNTEPLPQRRDSTTLPLSRLLAVEETLPPTPRPALSAQAPSGNVRSAALAALAESETMPLARMDIQPESEADSETCTEADTHPPPHRGALAARVAFSRSPRDLVLGGGLLFVLGFLLRACV
ncbi:MAG: serine/threonine protein kinase [Myxococcales bacterium]|nr:serine/threonine protein kinase [Myxococcales bacterium]